MTDPIRKKQGTPLPTLPPSPERMEKEVKHYNLNEMVIEGSVTSAPKQETFSVSRLWQSQSKDPAALMIVYDGEIQKYRQHLIAYVSHLIRHYEEMGITPNIGLSAPDFQMEPVQMNAMGKGDLFNALLDFNSKGKTPEGEDGLTRAMDWASGMLRHPKFHGDQKSVLLFTETISQEALLAEGVLLEGDKITLNVVRDFNRDVRLHGGTTPATWEDVTADLRAALSHIRPDVLEDKASQTDEFFLRLGAAQLKYPDKPLLELIHAVREDLKYNAEREIPFHANTPFTLPNCTFLREGCTLNLASAGLYFDYLREIGTFEAFFEYTDYTLIDFYFLEDMKDLLRYASMPVETLIDTLVRPENAGRAEMATELLRPESLTDAQKERIRSRIEAMIPLSPDEGLFSDANRGIFRMALQWRLAFDAIPEMHSLDERFIRDYQTGSEELIFENAKLLHPDLLVAAFRHAISFEGKNFRWEGEWGKWLVALDRKTRGRVIRELMHDVDKEPWRARLRVRAIRLEKQVDDSILRTTEFSFDWLNENYSLLEFHPSDVILLFQNFLSMGEYSRAFYWVIQLLEDSRYKDGMEDPTVTAEDPEPLHLYLKRMFEHSLVKEKEERFVRTFADRSPMALLLKRGSKDEWEEIALGWTRELLTHELPFEFYDQLASRVRFPHGYEGLFEVLYAFAGKHPKLFKEEMQSVMTSPVTVYSEEEQYIELLPLLRWIDDQTVEGGVMTPELRETLKMWADEFANLVVRPEIDFTFRQMMIYRLQRIIKRVGCSDTVHRYLGPESGAEKQLQGSPEADEIWRESLKPIQEACGKK